MTATNHVLTGALLLAAVPHFLMLPLVLLTHFALDALPHYGDRNNPAAALSRLKYILPIDAGIAGGLLVGFAMLQPQHWILVILGGILCASPDLAQIPRYLRFLNTKDTSPDDNWFGRFHSRIQWGERQWGIWIEIVWAILAGYLLFKLA